MLDVLRDTSINMEQLLSMLTKQHALNNAYNGVGWFEDPSFNIRFKSAADKEWAEFLDEVNTEWDWYSKNKSHFDKDAALFELIDVTHFMLAATLRYGDVDCIKEALETDHSLIHAFQHIQSEGNFIGYDLDDKSEWFTRLSESYVDFWQQHSMHWRSGDVDQEELGLIICRLLKFIELTIVGFSITPNMFVEAYNMKNERNFNRVRNGVMNGVDVKKDEVALKIPEVK